MAPLALSFLRRGVHAGSHFSKQVMYAIDWKFPCYSPLSWLFSLSVLVSGCVACSEVAILELCSTSRQRKHADVFLWWRVVVILFFFSFKAKPIGNLVVMGLEITSKDKLHMVVWGRSSGWCMEVTESLWDNTEEVSRFNGFTMISQPPISFIWHCVQNDLQWNFPHRSHDSPWVLSFWKNPLEGCSFIKIQPSLPNAYCWPSGIALTQDRKGTGTMYPSWSSSRSLGRRDVIIRHLQIIMPLLYNYEVPLSTLTTWNSEITQQRALYWALSCFLTGREKVHSKKTPGSRGA